ncbi:MAG: ShlB/FhaC/HecB family hemolysin secretion/activation protein, partial [Cyanobacteria bacterium J06635_13]
GWNNDAEELEFSTLIGTGFGLLLQTPERFSARFDWGIPLINSDDQGSSLQEDGVYLQLEYSFF